jgi:type I restriction enzyme, S subunit
LSLVTPRKGYKSVPWLFGKEIEIPEEWEYGRIEHFCNKITSGGTPNRDNSEYYGGQIPWIKSGELKNNFLSESEEKISEKGLSESSAKLFPKNTLLIAMYGVTIGKTAILEKEATTNQAICAILPNTNFDSFYLQQLLISMKNILISFGMGAGQPNINQEIIKTLHIPLPPLPEQQKIATILSNVDNLIESTGKVITHSKKVKTGLMQKLLTRGIGHTKFKDTRFGKLPEEWNIVNLKNISSIIDTPHYTSPNYESGIPIIRTSDCDTNGRINYSKTKFTDKSEYENRRQHIDPNVGDILFTREAPCGVAVVVDKKEIAVGQRIILLKTDLEQILNSFMILFLNSFYGLYQTKIFAISTTVERVNISDIKKFLIPLPPLPEQQKIASILSNIDSKITSQEQYKEKLEKLKKSLMQKLLTGEVRV